MIAVTGANGLVGRVLVQYFLDSGLEVLCLQRNKPETTNKNQYWSEYHLENETLPDFDYEIDCLIHCALSEYSQQNQESDSINLKAAKAILHASKQRAFKTIFISTLSAHENARSHYGKNKLAIESLFLASGGVVLRLGLVISRGGALETIFNMIKSLPVHPSIGTGNENIQLLSSNQLCAFVVRGVSGLLQNKIYHLGNSSVITMNELCAEAACVLNKRYLRVPIPLFLLEIVIFLGDKLRIPLPVSRETILGLKAIKYVDTRLVFEEESVIPEDPKTQIKSFYLNLLSNSR